MSKRTPSEATLKSRAMSAYFKAEAKFTAAHDAMTRAMGRAQKAADDLKAARAECERLGCPLPSAEPQP